MFISFTIVSCKIGIFKLTSSLIIKSSKIYPKPIKKTFENELRQKTEAIFTERKFTRNLKAR